MMNGSSPRRSNDANHLLLQSSYVIARCTMRPLQIAASNISAHTGRFGHFQQPSNGQSVS